jgi:hypothetical protein
MDNNFLDFKGKKCVSEKYRENKTKEIKERKK